MVLMLMFLSPSSPFFLPSSFSFFFAPASFLPRLCLLGDFKSPLRFSFPVSFLSSFTSISLGLLSSAVSSPDELSSSSESKTHFFLASFSRTFRIRTFSSSLTSSPPVTVSFGFSFGFMPSAIWVAGCSEL